MKKTNNLIAITIQDHLNHVIQTHPEARGLLEYHGFVLNDAILKAIGNTLTLEMALKSKKINTELFFESLNEALMQGQEQGDATLKTHERDWSKAITIQGILPCPVRVPLLEGFESWLKTQETDYQASISYELKAASMGVDWIKNDLKDAKTPDVLADVFLSAGFDLFFDPDLLGKFKAQNVFKDQMPIANYNDDFNQDHIQLKDPKGAYSMVAVVPAVFLINKNVLGDRKMPESWAELLTEPFENAVSLPVGDFDLFNAILLNIHKQYGDAGILKLKKSFCVNLHPSEMVKSHQKPIQPAVTIMPYFFSKMARDDSPMVAVWPKDGAIISPIFMLTKVEKQAQLQPIVDFFASKAVGEILSHNGRFPSVHPEVDNQIPKDKGYMWLGWDYIESNNIAQLMRHCETLFDKALV